MNFVRSGLADFSEGITITGWRVGRLKFCLGCIGKREREREKERTNEGMGIRVYMGSHSLRNERNIITGQTHAEICKSRRMRERGSERSREREREREGWEGTGKLDRGYANSECKKYIAFARSTLVTLSHSLSLLLLFLFFSHFPRQIQWPQIPQATCRVHYFFFILFAIFPNKSRARVMR